MLLANDDNSYERPATCLSRWINKILNIENIGHRNWNEEIPAKDRDRRVEIERGRYKSEFGGSTTISGEGNLVSLENASLLS